jgi:hypothetical protein
MRLLRKIPLSRRGTGLLSTIFVGLLYEEAVVSPRFTYTVVNLGSVA